MNSGIQIHQRVTLAGSKLLGTTMDRWWEKGVTKGVWKFEVKWDTGSTGVVKEEDLEHHVTRKYDKAA